MSATEEDVLKKVLDSYGDEFKEIAETWKQLDQKAQGTTAIAGIFLAAVFAWARELPKLIPAELAILALVVFALAASIIFALLSMRVRTATLPPFGKVTHDIAEDCCSAMNDPASVPRFYRQLAASWREANDALAGQVGDKAHWAYVAQVVLAWAAAGASLLAILAISKGAA